MPLFQSRLHALALLAFIGTTYLFVTWHRREDSPHAASVRWDKLGFDDIYVVGAGQHDWRAKGLAAAAERTNLTVTFLTQPKWTLEQKKAFHAGDNYSHWDIPGSTGCWLGHLHALRRFLDQGQSVALIVEDDADWDLAIQEQARRASHGIRWLTQHRSAEGWGTDFDILYLGHCGDRLPQEHFAYQDVSVSDIATYTGFHYGTLNSLSAGTRAVHHSIRPVCTFGYAVTRAGAEKILAMDHNAKAIDVRLGRACKRGELRCLTVNPELIHHHVPAGEAPSEIQLKQAVVEKAFTANIVHSARCNAGRPNDDLVTCSEPVGTG